MTVYGVKLTTSSPEVVRFKGRDTFRIVITASDAENMPNEIFGHKKTLVDPDPANIQQDEFCFVCSAYDLSFYPANAPNPEQSPPFFRKATIDILLPSVTKFDEVYKEIKEQVDLLISVLGNLDTLGTPIVTWHPTAPTTTTSTTTSTTTTTAAP